MRIHLQLCKKKNFQKTEIRAISANSKKRNTETKTRGLKKELLKGKAAEVNEGQNGQTNLINNVKNV